MATYIYFGIIKYSVWGKDMAWYEFPQKSTTWIPENDKSQALRFIPWLRMLSSFYQKFEKYGMKIEKYVYFGIDICWVPDFDVAL